MFGKDLWVFPQVEVQVMNKEVTCAYNNALPTYAR